MKIKLGQIVNSQQPLQSLLQEKMPFSTAFKLSSIVKKVNGSLETFEELRGKLIQKYGEDDKIDPKHENWEKFVEEMNELLLTEQTLTIDKIKQSELSKCQISASDLLALEFMIKEK